MIYSVGPFLWSSNESRPYVVTGGMEGDRPPEETSLSVLILLTDLG